MNVKRALNFSIKYCAPVALMVLMLGCATGPAAPVSDAGESNPPQVLETSPRAGEPEREADSAADNGWRPPEQGSSTSSAPAVASLLDRARSDYNGGDYPRAIAGAERALRIDRRNPEAYLILAQSYWRLARPTQSEQFARQGLRYSGDDAALTRSLQRVLAQVAGG